jgi:hypothetical protein
MGGVGERGLRIAAAGENVLVRLKPAYKGTSRDLNFFYSKMVPFNTGTLNVSSLRFTLCTTSFYTHRFCVLPTLH